MNSRSTNVASRLGGIGLALFLTATGAMAQLCPPGYYSPNGMVNEEIPCPPGYYTPTAGMTSPDQAVPGYYVSFSGSSSETPCPGGYYAPGYATVTPTLCPGGYYTPSGSAMPIPCPGGYYAPAGSAAPTTCPAGYYAPAGSSSPILCPVGHYDPAGSSAPITCAAGYYAPNPGMPSPTPAAPGYYVPSPGSSSETVCPAGYFAPGLANVTPTISPPGDFVPGTGASFPTVDPSGTWSHAGSIAARSASPSAPRNLANHIVGPIYFATPSPTIDLTSGPASLTVSNASTDLGVADALTGLSLLSATLSGGNAADFQITGFSAGTVLYEKGATSINLSVINPSSLGAGTYSTTLIVQTDQSAPFGSPGDSFNYTVTFTVPAPPSLTISLADPTDAVLTWTNAGYNLQTAPQATGAYTNIPGATSPYTNAITSGSLFFRLIKQ